MEYYVAEDQRPLVKCLNDVISCDLYLGIFAWRYGYIPPGSNESITAQEFRQACRCERETLLFLVDPQAPWPEKFKERGLAERRLQSLCADIKARVIADYFSSPTDLSTKVAVALARWERPKRTPQEVERKHRLLPTWMYSPPGEERERAKQGLRHMASKRYIAVLHQYLIEERGTETELLSYLDEFVMLCGPTPETISVLRDLIWGASYKLKRSAIYQLGELWLSGQKPCSKLLETLPEIAAAINPELLYQLIHAIEKLARVHRLGEAQEAPREIISSLETIAKVPSSGPHDPNRARRLLNALQKQSTS